MEKTLIHIYPFWLVRSIRAINAKQLRDLRNAGIDLTIEQWVLLLGVENYNGETQRYIAEMTFKDTANVHRILTQLSNKGFVVKYPHAEDGRKTTIKITDKGRAIIEKALPIMDNVRKQGLEDISEKEFDYMMAALKKIYHNLE